MYSADWKTGGKKNFANGRIIKGDSDRDASGSHNYFGCFHLLLNRTRTVWVRDGRREDAHRAHAYTRIHRPRPVILISDTVIGFSIPVVKFPSSGPIALRLFSNTQPHPQIVSKDSRHIGFGRRKIRGQNISLSFFFLYEKYESNSFDIKSNREELKNRMRMDESFWYFTVFGTRVDRSKYWSFPHRMRISDRGMSTIRKMQNPNVLNKSFFFCKIII